jgi:hypothetical protein
MIQTSPPRQAPLAALSSFAAGIATRSRPALMIPITVGVLAVLAAPFPARRTAR